VADDDPRSVRPTPATDPALASRALAVTPPSPPQARPPSRSACRDRAAATRRGIHLPGCHLGASASSLDECSQTADTRLAPRQRTMLLRTNHGQEVRRQGDKSAEDLLELLGDRKELLTWETEALKERTWRRQAA